MFLEGVLGSSSYRAAPEDLSGFSSICTFGLC